LPLIITTEMNTTQKIGVVKFYNMALGYGFITVIENDGSLVDYFSHHTGLNEQIRAKDTVRFDPTTSNKGLLAVNVSLIKRN
jgi:cold shock CspA family protein